MLHAPLALLAGLFAVSITIAAPDGLSLSVPERPSATGTLTVAGLR